MLVWERRKIKKRTYNREIKRKYIIKKKKKERCKTYYFVNAIK